jgi:hypothetical protein
MNPTIDRRSCLSLAVDIVRKQLIRFIDRSNAWISPLNGIAVLTLPDIAADVGPSLISRGEATCATRAAVYATRSHPLTHSALPGIDYVDLPALIFESRLDEECTGRACASRKIRKATPCRDARCTDVS